MSLDELQNLSEAPLESPDTRSELEVLQEKATALGISFRSNTGVEKLREKINAVLNDEAVGDEEEDEATEATSSIPKPSAEAGAAALKAAEAPRPKTEGELRRDRRMAAHRLIRCRITCHNPNKNDWDAEYFSIGNDEIGTIRRLVPFEVDWHVPEALLNFIKSKQYQHFYTVTEQTPMGPQKVRRSKSVREFSVELLPQLSEDELESLRKQQAVNGSYKED
ncbi:hypothetical protein [Pseudomonas phage vB_PaeP_4029]|uniref:N4 gp55-like protein n=4 Tax=Litunavirus Ab09 TaxID=1920765 RepID=A0A2K8HW95_9CAUD|nr:hypothetical protein BI066_gp45 [Pseudomonas phage PEV2]AIZ94827.1 hypothetical protein [Pseudomonas phage RWG]AIZ95010.1 hypothetical protein [Pseudomonas phage phi176]ASZ72125.1 hypothetical protein vBPaePPYO2_00076 [Pseudomonas phage vB_PaeP_PYO2]ASZ72283.1 hypothetical protein vBPaePDEV_00076 [Pseudomonas phage vB_PaeP_DEV]UNY40782.1 hypothetical protein [Pseudomonas phage CMS1]UYE96479.1 hypothetical protein [Pseudomonas phage vB_PaeP_4029]UYE96488.1 hypothetical protein [Pseudomonas